MPKGHKQVRNQYKRATDRFINYMMENTPVYAKGKQEPVKTHCAAADWMYDQRHVPCSSVMRDLEIAIHLRREVARKCYYCRDSGHRHFIKILHECLTVLRKIE